MECDPVARRRGGRIEPERRFVVDQGQQHRSRRRDRAAPARVSPSPAWRMRPGPRHGVEHGAEAGLRAGDRIGEAGQGDARRSCAHVPHGEELHPGRRRLRARRSARCACCAAASGAITLRCSAARRAGSCSSASASAASSAWRSSRPGDIGMADLAGLRAHGAARHRHFAQVERRAAAAGAAAHHDQAGLRPAQAMCRPAGRRRRRAAPLSDRRWRAPAPPSSGGGSAMSVVAGDASGMAGA